MISPAPGTTLELRGLTAGYGTDAVLHRLSITIAPGKLTALLGPSGCGKTTALKVVAGLLSPLEGQVLFDGENVNNVPAEHRRAAMVFQKPLLFPYLTVGDNIAFGLKMQRLPRADVLKRVAEGLDMVKLSGFERRNPGELSGGQEQRVSLARALVTNPCVLLLDEPFSALDERLRADMRNLVRDLQRKLGITSVFVTHDQGEAVQIADDIALLIDGRIEQVGPPRTFYETPRTAAVARFFGWQSLHGVQSNGMIFYRAERARVADLDEPCSADELAIPCEIRQIIDLGVNVLYKLGSPSGAAVEALLAHHASDPRLPSGSRVSLRLALRHTVSFPAEGHG